MGLEPTTLCLGSRCSTTELLPLGGVNDTAEGLRRHGCRPGDTQHGTTPLRYRLPRSWPRPGPAAMLAWLWGFGAVERVGVEGTGSYGAGLARFLHAEGVTVVEVNRPNRQLRRSHDKADLVDAVAAARAAQSGEATAEAKARNGAAEAIRALLPASSPARLTTDRRHHFLSKRPCIPIRSRRGASAPGTFRPSAPGNTASHGPTTTSRTPSVNPRGTRPARQSARDAVRPPPRAAPVPR